MTNTVQLISYKAQSDLDGEYTEDMNMSLSGTLAHPVVNQVGKLHIHTYICWN